MRYLLNMVSAWIEYLRIMYTYSFLDFAVNSDRISYV